MYAERIRPESVGILRVADGDVAALMDSSASLSCIVMSVISRAMIPGGSCRIAGASHDAFGVTLAGEDAKGAGHVGEDEVALFLNVRE